MKKLFKNLKFLWSLVVFFFLLGVFSIVLLAKIQSGATPLIMLMIVSFILMSVSLQVATVYTLRKKRKVAKKNLMTCSPYDWTTFRKNLLNSDFKEYKTAFGFIYIKIIKKVAYRISAVNDTVKYFDSSNDEKIDVDFSKCKKLIGFEVFKDPNNEQKEVITRINIGTDSLYYRGLYIEEKTITCPDVIVADNNIKEEVKFLEEVLNISLSAPLIEKEI